MSKEDRHVENETPPEEISPKVTSLSQRLRLLRNPYASGGEIPLVIGALNRPNPTGRDKQEAVEEEETTGGEIFGQGTKGEQSRSKDRKTHLPELHFRARVEPEE